MHRSMTDSQAVDTGIHGFERRTHSQSTKPDRRLAVPECNIKLPRDPVR